MEGVEELGMAGKDSGTGGSYLKGLRDVLKGGSAGGSAGSDLFFVGYVGADPPHETGPGKLPAQGRQTYNGEAF